MTTTESLASGLPMIIINPIPGQEEENAEFLEKNGVGVWIRKNDNPDEIISRLFENSEKIEEMREKTKTLCKINSTKDICEIVLNK